MLKLKITDNSLNGIKYKGPFKPHEKKILSNKWQTREGKVLTLGEMNDGHLRNATKMLSRALIVLSDEEDAVWSVLGSLMGDMAILSVEREAMSISGLRMRAEDMHELLIKACKIRKIQL